MTLDQILIKHRADKSSQGHGYNEVYEAAFNPLRDKPITLLEIGVFQGASIATWLEYFPNAMIVGLDCEPQVPSYGRYYFVQGRQENPELLNRLKLVYPNGFDIVIDDGGHVPVDQATSFRALWPYVVKGGYYFIEDIHPWFDVRHNDVYHNGSKELLWEIANAINWSGKQYCGRPFPAEIVSSEDAAFHSLTMTRGLLKVRKNL